MNQQESPEIQKRKHLIVMLPLVIIPLFFCVLLLTSYIYFTNRPAENNITNPTITPTPTQEPISYVTPTFTTFPMLNSFVTDQFNNNFELNGVLYLDFEKCIAEICSHYLLEKSRVSLDFPILKTYAEFPINTEVGAPSFALQKFMISGYYSRQAPSIGNEYYLLTDHLEILVIAQFEGNISVPGQYLFSVMATNPPPSIKYEIDELTASSLLILPTLNIGDLIGISGDVGEGSGAAGTSYIPLTSNIVIKAVN